MPLRPRGVIKEYLLNASIHGLRFIADDKLHWTERIFWVICVIFSWYASILLILASVDAFLYNSISFGMETSYKDWDTHFPAVAICENPNEPKVFNVSDTIWTLDHAIDLEEVLKELAYFRGVTYYVLQYCNRPNADPLCPQNNFAYYANLVRSKCHETISDCVFHDKKFDCCKWFVPIETDIGRCFILNSDQVVLPPGQEELDVVSNWKVGPGKLTFTVHLPLTVFTTGDDEVPSLTTMQANFFPVTENMKYRRHISIRNIENDPGLRLISPERRNCRYPDENFLDVYPMYSRSACIVQCRKDWQMKLCNCTDHFMPNTKTKDQCNLTGLVCLNKHNGDLSVLKPQWAQRKGLVCECPSSCTEDDLSIIKDDKLPSETGKPEVEIIMEFLPSERFRRNVVRSRMDLVVSTGGTAGLFVGASLLSFVELLYYLTIRHYGTVYMEKKKLLEAEKSKEDKKNKIPVVKLFSDNRRIPIIDIKRTRNDFRSFEDYNSEKY